MSNGGEETARKTEAPSPLREGEVQMWEVWLGMRDGSGLFESDNVCGRECVRGTETMW